AFPADADDRRRDGAAGEGARYRRRRRGGSGARNRAPPRRRAGGRRRPARRLGALTGGFDVRDVVREQIESLGAKFLDLGVRGEQTAGGYAQELTPEQQAQQQAALEQRLPDFDAVITTEATPGRPAPKLIPASAVRAMRAGSVIVDLAAATGGNCELT